MDIINLPRLRNKELQTISENSLRICGEITEVKPAIDKVNATFETFVKGMQKEKIDGQSKTVYDKIRDRYTSGFMANVRSEKYYNHTEEDAAIVDSLIKVLSKYAGIYRLPLNEQTAATDNLLDEVKAVLGDNEALPQLSRWLPLIEETNNKFKLVSSEFIKDSAGLKETEAATQIAPQLSDDLQNLYTLMFAHATIGVNANIVNAYKELEVLIASVN